MVTVAMLMKSSWQVGGYNHDVDDDPGVDEDLEQKP